jgi:orotidine-5'-phosphate decarboxylase
MASERERFRDLISRQWHAGKFLCIGLDTDIRRLPQACAPGYDDAVRVLEFNRDIVDATNDIVCAYKPNIAFYEALGSSGIAALEQTIMYIHEYAPEVPVIVDAKRADIGSTNEQYATALYDQLQADAVTVHPYPGREALEPFLTRSDKGVLVLVRTSNPGSNEIQDLLVNDKPFYLHVAHNVFDGWNKRGNCGVVAAATYPRELHQVRQTVGPMPILIPGIGAQEGDLEKVMAASFVPGSGAIIINASRSIIFASDDEHYSAEARRSALTLHEAIVRSTQEHGYGKGGQ